MFFVGIFLLVFVGALCAADRVVSELEDRPQSRFGRALAALERISGTAGQDDHG